MAPSDTVAEVTKQTVVATTAGGRYIHKLCKHFTHRVTAEWSEYQGLVNFDMGSCVMTDDGCHLSFVCTAQTESDLNEILETVKSHFDRFALKDQLVIKEWW